MTLDLNVVVGSAIATFAVQLVSSLDVKSHLKKLYAWNVELAKHVHFNKAPPAPGKRPP